MSTHGSGDKINSSGLTNPRFIRHVPPVGLIGVAFFLVCTVGNFCNRGQVRKARVNALLKFDASIEARYGEYTYIPPPAVTSGGTTLVLGGGQRLLGYYVSDEPSRLVGWVVPVLGKHCFARVTDIDVSYDDRFSDADVNLLLAFPDLRAINLSGTAVTDDGLAKLTAVEQLTVLDVSNTDVSPKSLRVLAKCKHLKELDISYTCADEEVVDYLKRQLPGCRIRW